MRAARSPVLSHLSSTIQGLHTVRAHKVQDIFLQEFFHHQDLHSSAWFAYLSTMRWFLFHLDMLGTSFITLLAFCSVAAAESKCFILIIFGDTQRGST